MSSVGGGEQFERLLSAASAYWGKRHHRPGACVVVEAMQQDVRLVVRNLLLANAICDVTSARLVVLTGTDRELSGVLWERFDVERVRRLAEAFGAAEIIDVHDLVDRRLADEGDSPADGIGSAALEALERATLLRLSRMPRLPETEDERHHARRGRARALSAVYDRLFAELSPVALVTGQVDYDQWGLAVETAMRRDVPVVHTQSTGSLGAYALFPQADPGTHADLGTSAAAGTPGAGGFREVLTGRLARYFDECVWPHRDLIRPGAELVAWRVKGDRGSWWRGGSVNSFELRTETERRQLRGHGCDRLGLDPDRPTITVFQHAVSDAVGMNRETFDDFAEWCEETAEFAAAEDAVNWLFLDHPEQDRHDSTGHFAALAERHSRRPHLAFMPRRALSKNMLWSMTDVGVTVRGRVACELPAFGIPVIQACWSEWSGCGLSHVAETRADYWRLLAEAVARHTKGESLLAPEQRERARLWLWLRRSGADVSSPLLPHWELGEGEEYLRALSVSMRHVERDGDPLHRAVRRMWERRDPVLSRFDFHDPAGLAEALTASRGAS
ncbi:hypothetical protein ACTMTF_13820 [Nonomuraea sp. ZG12]|uniref:hypothetical protein n=1 Tax=Nonomuraea sp. ZG12 TaxID=3452207 RepID=UPI003F8B9FCE